MRKLEKILLAGTFLTLPMLPLSNGVATSQTTISNDQSVLNVQTTNPVTVDTVSGTTTAVTTATGNSLLSATDFGTLDVESIQSVGNLSTPGTVTGNLTLTATANGGSQMTVVTAATGNDAETASSDGGGAVSGNFTQSVAVGSLIKSENNFGTANATVGDVSANSQAIANALAFNVANTTTNVTTTQTNSATVDSETGGLAHPSGAAFDVVEPGDAAVSTTAVGNNLSGTGTGASGQTINTTQVTDGPLVQAGNFVNVGTAQTVQGAATATANNVAVDNQGGPVVVANNQTTSGTTFTFADSVATAAVYGTGQSSALSVGNSVLAGNQGPSTNLSNLQVDLGGVEASSSFAGGTDGEASYDATSTATATGNAAIAYACSQCGGVLNVNNNQTSGPNGVEANSSMTSTGSNRSVNSVATAVGNSATFYVSRPNN